MNSSWSGSFLSTTHSTSTRVKRYERPPVERPPTDQCSGLPAFIHFRPDRCSPRDLPVPHWSFLVQHRHGYRRWASWISPGNRRRDDAGGSLREETHARGAFHSECHRRCCPG